MAALQSSLLPCTTSTSTSLSTESSSLFCKPSSGFRFHVPKLKFRSSRIRTALKLENPEAKPSVKTRKFSHFSRARPSSESGRLFSLLSTDSVSDCRQIHGLAVKLSALGFGSLVGNKLVALYSRNEGLLENAQKLFDEIPERKMPGYAALITGFCRSKRWEDLFLVLGLMVSEGLLPDKYVVPTVLKACSALRMSKSGKMLHGLVVRKGFYSDIFVGNSLIDLYANCGDLRSSRYVFESMGKKDVVSWTSLVSGYMDVGVLDEATKLFHSMKLNGVEPDLISWNALVSGFAKNGEVDLALQYLDEMNENGVKPRVNSWNGIISGCVQNKYFEDALDAFHSMLQFPEDPNFITIASILPACAGLGNLDLGKVIHGFSIRHGLCLNVHVEGSLINMYSKCGRSNYAERVFAMEESKNTAMWNEMISVFVNEGKMAEALELLGSMQKEGQRPDVISFNTLFAGYARNGRKEDAYGLFFEMRQMNVKPNIVSFNILISGFQQSGLAFEALKLFQAMQSPSNGSFSDLFAESARPNSITTTSALAACADLNSRRQGKEIHRYLLRSGFEHNIYVLSALVHMYSKCHDIVSATKVFRRIEDRNTICWNALIAGHVNSRQPELALELFREMFSEGVDPSLITLMILLLACGDIGALRSGRELHGYIIKRLVDKCDPNLANALIGMYTKCGSILEAKSVFNSEVKEDITLWKSIISTYSVYGIPKHAITLFEQLELVGIWPHHC